MFPMQSHGELPSPVTSTGTEPLVQVTAPYPSSMADSGAPSF